MTKLALLLAVTVLAAGSAAAAERLARIEVTGLYCPSCSFIVAEALKKAAPGVEIAGFEDSADGTSAVYRVRFDDAVTTADDIAARPAAYGYSGRLLAVEPAGS